MLEFHGLNGAPMFAASGVALSAVVLGAHLVGDFFVQSNRAATNKHHSWLALWEHVWTYTVFLAFVASLVADPYVALAFAAVNGAAHFAIDAVTSRLGTWFWLRAERAAAAAAALAYPYALPARGRVRPLVRPNLRNFYQTLGVDQFAHTVLLLATATWLAAR